MKTFGKYMLVGSLLCSVGVANAQDSYDAQTFANSDLNGTARFVSMGGALGALGGDISVMSTNPAGTALYRKSDAAISISELFSGDGAMGHDGYRMSLDQGGVLIAFDMENPSGEGLQFVNFGVNYQKKRNFLFNQITDVRGLSNTFSQTYQMANMANWAMYDAQQAGLEYDRYFGTMLQAGADAVLVDKVDNEGNFVYDELGNLQYDGIPAKSAYYEKATYGANVQADINLSFNVSDQLFFGASVGVYDMDYRRESLYREEGIDGASYNFTNWYETRGDGFDVKLGFICRPFEDSPFRFGVNVHTPTWYRLTDTNGYDLYLNDKYFTSDWNPDYDYNYRTPWKFGLSLGHTVGNFFAIGAEYEYSDISTAKYSSIEDFDSNYFRRINSITKKMLKAQHTFKVGAEVKPTDVLSLRAGYNFISSPFKKDAYRPFDYDGIYTETDWTNWGDISRITCGFGYRFKGGYFDLAYQYQAQKGDFYAFDDALDTGEMFQSTQISANRSQVMATIGFRF